MTMTPDSVDGSQGNHKITEQELALICAIAAEEVKGLAVTYRQLQVLTRRKSIFSVQLLVKDLAARGYLLLTPGSARAIRLTRLGLSVATEGIGAARVLPIRGVRRSFHAAWAEAGAIEHCPIPGSVFKLPADYLIVGAGDATFPERGYFPGDLIAIKQTSEPQHQQLFLEEFGNRLRIGNALPKGKAWKLVGSEGSWISPEPRIVGQVVGVLRTEVTSRKRCRPEREAPEGDDSEPQSS